MYQATLNVGFLIGTIATGYLADRWVGTLNLNLKVNLPDTCCRLTVVSSFIGRFGRKISFLVSCLLNGIAGIIVAVAPNYVSLLVFRTLYGFGVKGGWVVGYVLSMEPVRLHRNSLRGFKSVG